MKTILFSILSFVFILSCNFSLQQKASSQTDLSIEKRFFTQSDSSKIKEYSVETVLPKYNENPCCRDKSNYIPDTNHLELTPEKWIRVNFHFVNSADSSRNFNEKKGKEYVRQLMNEAYNKYHNNQPMRLHPEGQTTPVLPTRYRYKLTPRPDDPEDDGIYFHYDDEFCDYITKGKNRTYGNRAVIKKYGVQLDTVMNVFLMSHPPDSVKSKTYKAFGHGVALGNAVKIAGAFSLNIKPWAMQKHLNHEIAHNFGLRHSWVKNDGCDDTPPHPNCWNQDAKPGCDSLASNNLMDYNVWQNAWTPCQIGIIHSNISRLKGRSRKYILPNWCNFYEHHSLTISESMVWEGERDIYGNLTIENGATLEIKCRLGIPKGGKIIIKPGGKLILNNAKIHNACGDNWLGIELEKKGDLEGKVELLGNAFIQNAENW